MIDLIVVIDRSNSTTAPSGADIDGDGTIGRSKAADHRGVFGKTLPPINTDEGDSVLAAEVEAVRGLLDQLDPLTTRVGIVYFSGDFDKGTPDAYTHVPLTSNYDEVSRGLDEILEMGPEGFTNMMFAVSLATAELLGLSVARSTMRPGAHRIVVLLSDGRPTLPQRSVLQNARLAISKASRAHRLGIEIYTLGIGTDATTDPIALVEIAKVGGAEYIPVSDPASLRATLERLKFDGIESIEIRNETLSRAATAIRRTVDGSFYALVPVASGINELVISAKSVSGQTRDEGFRLELTDGDAGMELPPHLRPHRAALVDQLTAR